MTTLSQVAQGGTVNAADVNQLVQSLTGQLLVNPGPMVQIATQVVTTTVATVTFSNIPAYNNLYLSWQARCTNATASANLALQVNGDASANYYDVRIAGFNGAAVVDRSTAATSMRIGEIAGSTAASTAETGWGFAAIPNWGNATAFLGGVSMAGYLAGTTATTIAAETFNFAYAVAAAKTSVTFATSGNFAGTVGGGCIFTLYGSM